MALALLHVCYSQPEAAVLKSRLAADGIRAFLFDAQINNAVPHMAVTFGGVRVMVPEQDLDRARTILGEREPATLETETEAFRRNTSKTLLGLAISFMFAWFPWWNRSRHFKDE